MSEVVSQVSSVSVKSDPVTVKEWLFISMISGIPLLNVIMFLVWAFGADVKPSQKNWAKAALILFATVFVLGLVLSLLLGSLFSSISSSGFDLLNYMN